MRNLRIATGTALLSLTLSVSAQEVAHRTAPSVASKVEPQYSPAARDAKIQGTVLLSVMIGVDGKPRDIRVVKSLDPSLDANAIASVEQWTFVPGSSDGVPVETRAQIEVNFKLFDDPQQ